MSSLKSLKDQLQRDLTAAIRARDDVTTATLRMALAAVQNEQVAGKQARELSDDEVVGVLTRETKRRRESAQAFEGGGRPELAARERAEGVVLERYLPAQLSDAELEEIVRAAVAETGATEMKQMGQVMKVVQPKVAGRAEGGRVAAEVKRLLAGG